MVVGTFECVYVLNMSVLNLGFKDEFCQRRDCHSEEASFLLLFSTGPLLVKLSQ